MIAALLLAAEDCCAIEAATKTSFILTPNPCEMLALDLVTLSSISCSFLIAERPSF
jgi:hypothetical protein